MADVDPGAAVADAPVSDSGSAAVIETPSGEYDFDETTALGPSSESTAASPPAAADAPGDASAKPALSETQLARAQAVGVTPEQLAAFKDPELGLAAVEMTAMRTMQAMQQQAMQQQHFAQQQAAAAAAANAPRPPSPPPTFDAAAMRKQYADQGYDDGIANGLVNLAQQQHQLAVDQYQTRLGQYEQNKWSAQAYDYIMRMDQQVKAQQTATQVELVNRDFADFKKELDPSIQKLIDGPAQQKLMATADSLLRGMHANGVTQFPSNKQLFEQAMYATLGRQIFSAARDEVRGEVRQAQGRAISRPASGQRSAAPKGEEAAVRFAEQWSREMGLVPTGHIRSQEDI